MKNLIIKRPVLSIFIISLILRLIFLAVFPPRQPGADEQGYIGIAESLLAGQGYSLEGKLTVYRTPTYPLLLAGLYAIFGFSAWVISLAQALLGALTTSGVFLLAKRLIPPSWAFVAGLIASIDPFGMYYINKQETETLFSFLVLLSLSAAYYSLDSKWRLAGGLINGIVWGVTAMCRPSVFLFIFVLTPLICLMTKKRQAIIWSVAAIAGFFLVTTPWAWRNKLAIGEYVFTSSLGAWVFWEGLNPNFDKRQDIDLWQSAMAKERDALEAQGYKSMDLDRYYWQKSKRYVYENPWAYAKLTLRKLIKFWRFYPYSPYSRVQRIISAFYFIPLLFLAALSLVWSAKNPDWLILHSFIAYFTMIQIIFWVQIRYRVPIHPILAIYAAAALSHLLPNSKVSSIFAKRV